MLGLLYAARGTVGETKNRTRAKANLIGQTGATTDANSIERLAEISSWLGTFRERPRLARRADFPALAVRVDIWNKATSAEPSSRSCTAG